MPEEQQIDLFAQPIALETVRQLPEWFHIQQLADALGYESHFDNSFRQAWYRDVLPHLEEREIYPGSRWPGPEYRGFFNEYRLVEAKEQTSEAPWTDY
jgi:hypothetical protein